MSIIFDLERTNGLNLLPDKDLVDLCPPIEPYQVTKSRVEKQIKLMNVFERHPQKFLLFHLENTHLERIQDLMKQYQSLPMDLADASLFILAEELGNGRILSIDNRDFNTYRWKNKKPFINLFPNF